LQQSTNLEAFICGSSLEDSDGNLYETVQIGTQCWMAENLRTTRFANGDSIMTEHDSTVSARRWRNSISSMWAVYDLNPQFEPFLGRLYNWYTVQDPRNLCPEGWVVPSNQDWSDLASFLGGLTAAGGKLKTTAVKPVPADYNEYRSTFAGLLEWNFAWYIPNTGASNTSGFKALPTGFRDQRGNFRHLFSHAYYWTSQQSGSDLSFARVLNYTSSNIITESMNWSNGLGVRCILNQ